MDGLLHNMNLQRPFEMLDWKSQQSACCGTDALICLCIAPAVLEMEKVEVGASQGAVQALVPQVGPPVGWESVLWGKDSGRK